MHFLCNFNLDERFSKTAEITSHYNWIVTDLNIYKSTKRKMNKIENMQALFLIIFILFSFYHYVFLAASEIYF